MKIKCFMTMMAAVAIVLGMSSCGSDDDDAEAPVAVASQVEGSYSGNEVIMVMGEESSNETKTYEFTKASDSSLDVTVPASGETGMMMIPALPVKNIPLTKSGDVVTGSVQEYVGKVTTAQGAEKNYTISDFVVAFQGKTVSVTFSLKYGNMPMTMSTTFTGEKK